MMKIDIDKLSEEEKETMRELEKALQEIERLRQENAELRKKLGTEVSKPKTHYSQ